MSDISDTTDLGEGYDRADEAVRHAIDQREDAVVHGVHDDHPGDHWTDLKFVYLAIALAVVTAIEVAFSYMVDELGPLFLPGLIILMLIKFFSVVSYFMHLRFDSRLFSLMFYMGLALAVGVYTVTLLTFRFFN